MDSLTDVRGLFDPAPNSIYLDTPTYGLPPKPTVQAMYRAVDNWQTGSADWVRDWDVTGDAARRAFAALIGVDAASVALEPSASVGAGMVAGTLGPEDEVLMSDDEYPSIARPLLVAAERTGARVRTVPFAELAASVRASTTLVAFSLVQSQSGRTADQASIVQAARAVGACTLVDATHALPFVPLVDGIDYMVCSAYKHLLCPRGVAFFSVAPARWDAVPPLLANWRNVDQPYAHSFGGGLDLASNAARFDVSLAWFSWVGAAVSLGLLREWQRAGVLDAVLPLAARLAQQLDLPQPRSTVLTVAVADAESVRADLERKGIKAAVRAGSVRLAPHVYTTVEQIDQAAAALAPFVLHATRP